MILGFLQSKLLLAQLQKLAGTESHNEQNKRPNSTTYIFLTNALKGIPYQLVSIPIGMFGLVSTGSLT